MKIKNWPERKKMGWTHIFSLGIDRISFLIQIFLLEFSGLFKTQREIRSFNENLLNDWESNDRDL